MRAKIYPCVILVVCMGIVSAPLWAQIIVPPEEPANIMDPAIS